MTPLDRSLAWTIDWQRGVMTRAQASAAGITASALQHRLRREGPWQRLLPGVYLTTTGQASRELPEPLYNPRLYVGDIFLAQPDAWWPQYGVAVEVDSREWHLSPADWEQTMARHRRMSAVGIIVVHLSPRQLRDEPARLAADLDATLKAGRPLPAVSTRPMAA